MIAAGPARHDDRPGATSVTVLAVAGQPVFLRAARQLNADAPGFEQVGEAMLEESPELPASPATVGAAAHLRKPDLSTRALREIWEAHGGSRMS